MLPLTMLRSTVSTPSPWKTRFAFGLLSTLIGVLISTILSTPAVNAAEKLVISYGPLNASVAIKDLETLVHTEEVPGSLRFYLGIANLDPDVLRSLLSMELGASSEFMTGMLESESGNQLLSQMSDVIHLPPNRPEIHVLKSTDQTYSEPTEADHIEALRTALLKAADDRRVTVLEVLQHYPTEKVYVDAVKLIRFANSLEPEAVEPAE